jgi:ABC-type amino acid transport substrate-binding protein
VKIYIRLLSMLVMMFAGFALAGCNPNRSANTSGQTVSRMSTILSRGTIRCSYLVYPPYLLKDANTGKLSGIMFDIMEEIGTGSELKIEWVEEVGYESIFTSVNSGRDDLFCGGLWPNASRVRAGTFSVPVFYSVVKAWGRSDESRFSNLSGINNPEVRIATIDGAMEDIIAKTDYPQATRVSLPQLSPFTQNLLNVTSRKADLTFAEPGIIFEYLNSNPGSLKELAPEKPARTFGNTIVVPKGDYQLKEFVDVALTELLYSGRVAAILQKYEPAPGVFPRAALPYDPATAVLKAIPK